MAIDKALEIKAGDDIKTKHIKLFLDVIVNIVKDMGAEGAPGGPLYMGLMTHGITFDQFNAIMGALVRGGRLRMSNHVYYFVK